LHQLLNTTFTVPKPRQNQSSLSAYRTEVAAMVARGLTPRVIYQILSERPEFSGSESAVYRLCVSLRPAHAPTVVARVETRPGEVAQVDFGEVGPLFDPQTQTHRRTYVFVMVLAWSRHMYAELVFDQKLPTWLLCHQHAFEFFKGVPQRIVLDNLKAAIMRAYSRDHEVEVQRAYADCAEHYGFLIDPCLPYHPQHKGKVERGGVGYIKQNFVPRVPADSTLAEANRLLRHWLLTTAGQRNHGTTHAAPWQRFNQHEQATLQPLPSNAYDPAIWKQVTLHRDGHVVFEQAFYSAPTRLVGQSLWLRAGLCDVRLLTSAFELVATHPRATQAGQRFTQPDHLPPEKVRGLTASRAQCQAQAEAIGTATAQVVAELLASRPVDKLRTALRVLRLADQYTAARLEAACVRGLAFGETSVPALKRMLAEGLDTLVMPRLNAPVVQPTFAFARSAEELAASLSGGAPWS
jgi:transposase